MEKEQRNRLQKATQDARKLLEEEFRSQLLQTYDIDVEKVRWAEEPGAHLQAEQRLIREKLVAWIEHKEAQINDRKEALLLALREMAFTALNRFVALKLMEARGLVRPSVSGGLESAGFLEFTAVAQGLLADQESSYRLYLETIFEDVSRELRALFDPRDPASLLWPKRAALLELLDILNRLELAELWSEDETLGWVYQYFNGDAERKKMREESSAPRNSRELAVRNQFFTPRYVVEFLTDNTLGRIWYEMRQGNTGLKDRCRYLVRRPNEVWLQPGEEPPAQADADEALNQEELLRQPVYIPHRPLKDPREIRMLDPACGSMHFGLYAFDLYLQIYTEAWEIARGTDEQTKDAGAFSSFLEYAGGFANKASFIKEVPQLILQHNVHGIDIDSRATQIARLTLWLRAQRAWQVEGTEVISRPTITRSNVACAEPMPGESELLSEFVDQQFSEAERGLVRRLLEAIFNRMQIAGEAGSLLRIEDCISNEIIAAYEEWRDASIYQHDLFESPRKDLEPRAATVAAPDEPSINVDFWTSIEDRLIAALKEFSQRDEHLARSQYRLFKEDAVKGFAFIEICIKRFDVVLMNPPFGLECGSTTSWLRKEYSGVYSDIFSCFVARGLCLASQGIVGAITSRAFLVGRRHTEFRQAWFLPKVASLLDLGSGVMDDAMVQSCAYTLQDSPPQNGPSIYDWREVAVDDKSGKALSIDECIVFDTSIAKKLPFSRFVYSMPHAVVSLFDAGTSFEGNGGYAKAGMNSFDDFRFVRAFWEVPAASIGFPNGWVRFAKGGEATYYRSPLYLVIGRHSDGRELDALNIQLHGSSAQVRQASRFWGLPGCTYSRRSSKYFAVRALPADFVFSSMGPVVLPATMTSPAFLVAFLNSLLMQALVHFQASANDFQTGIIKSLPFAELDGETITAIEDMGDALVKAKRNIDALDEVDPEFSPLAFRPSLYAGFHAESRLIEDNKNAINTASAEVDSIIGKVYGKEALRWAQELLLNDQHGDSSLSESGAIRNIDVPNKCTRVYASKLISVLIGVVFGRWDARTLLGQQCSRLAEDPFLPLPLYPPGQLLDASGMPVIHSNVPEGYPVEIAWDGILVDDAGHTLDVEHKVRLAIDKLCGVSGSSAAEEFVAEACNCLGAASLRDWLSSPDHFFADHLKSYSQGPRCAPIYWHISSGSGAYTLWIYYHRLSPDSLFRMSREFVEPRIQQAERDLLEYESSQVLIGETAARFQKEQSLLQDLRILRIELDLIAPLWNPNLNDGVIVNHAILWRITPYTPWQKKCKECWDKLVKGDYDWAHLAFHLWPERVIPKCVTDRSLAIAHGLEERLWQETNNGNWLPRQLSEADLKALIAEQSNPAVKSALGRFLAAPPPVAPSRTRASRSTRASGSSTPRRARGSAAVVDAEATRQVLLALTAAPSDGLAKTQIADLIGVEANAITAVIKQLKEGGQIGQLGERRGARYVLSEQGRAAVAADAGEEA